MFELLSTERLLLRQPRPADADAFHAYRNEEEVARWQDWPTPFLRERADVVIGEAAALTDMGTGEWMMLVIADADDTEVFGDLFVEFSNDGRTGELGYSLRRSAWGQGYASEAVDALVTWLFGRGRVTRVCASLHPDNHRSARVLERCGLEFEGHTRNSYWLDDENSDDLLYGVTPERYRQWIDRPQHAPDVVELIEPYPIGLRDVLKLGVHHSQNRFVSPISTSLAQVAVPPPEQGFDDDSDGPKVVPWPRIIHADGVAVGFVMMEQPTELNPEPYLWRLLIDRSHQRRGIGGRVVDMVIDQAKAWGSESLIVSWVPGVGSPEPMYLAKGFVPTGEIDDGETVARLQLG